MTWSRSRDIAWYQKVSIPPRIAPICSRGFLEFDPCTSFAHLVQQGSLSSRRIHQTQVKRASCAPPRKLSRRSPRSLALEMPPPTKAPQDLEPARSGTSRPLQGTPRTVRGALPWPNILGFGCAACLLWFSLGSGALTVLGLSSAVFARSSV